MQIGDQNDEIKQKWKLVPCKCDRAHLVRSSALRSNARGTIERRHVDPRFPRRPSRPLLHRFNTCAVGILRQFYAIDRILCDRAQCGRMQSPRSNAHAAYTALGSNAVQYDRAYTGLRLIALLAIERTSDLVAHLCLSINRTLLFSFKKRCLGDELRRPQWPKTSLFFIVNTPKRRYFI